MSVTYGIIVTDQFPPWRKESIVKRKILAALLVIVLVVTMAVPALAATASAGAYGTIRGGSILVQLPLVRSSTSITSNPDFAMLTMKMYFYRDEGTDRLYDYHTTISDAGVTSFVDDFSYADCVYNNGFFTPRCGECTHTVMGDGGYYSTYSYVTVPQ